MQDEVDGAAASLSAEMVVEPGAVDGEDGARAFPACFVATVAAVSEGDGDALEGDAPERVGLKVAARLHGPSSALAAATWAVSTLRVLAAAAAWSA